MNTQTSKIGLSVREAGWFLQKTESQIRGMLRRGELEYVVEGRRIDPASVRPGLGGDYARLLLDLVLAGEFEVPKLERRYGPPAPLYPAVLEFVVTTGCFLHEDEIEHAMDAFARLGQELVRTRYTTPAIEPRVR
jgi:hypothetical protein